MEINRKLIGQKVREARSTKGLSQATLAEEIDMSVPYISHIETARKQASLKVLIRIADVLGVTVDMLLSGNQANDPLECHYELAKIMESCNSYEKRFIYELAKLAKDFIRKNCESNLFR